MGGRRTRTDPTVWCFSSEGLGTTYALGTTYVDDFMITGIAGQRVEQHKSGLRELFSAGFVRVAEFWSWRCWSSQKKVDHMIVLDQTSNVNSGSNSINI